MAKNEIPNERKEIQRIVESYFDTFRAFKYERFERKEAQITGSYEVRYHAPTGVTSDSTSRVGIYNVFTPIMLQEFCERIERAVDRLQVKELKIIKLRYMQREPPLDMQVHRQLQISHETYRSRREAAFVKLVSVLRLEYESVLNNITTEE